MRRFKEILKRRSGDVRGFTLLEAVISMAVFSIGVLGVAAMQTTAVSSNTLSENVQANTCIAMAQSEELMAVDDGDARIENDIPFPFTTLEGHDVRVEPTTDANIPGTKRIQVTTTFQAKGLRPQTITLNIIKPRIN